MKRPFTALYPRLGRLIPVFVLAAFLALFLSGCDADTPQNTFDPKGEVADKQADVFYWSMWPAIAIMILVLGGLLVIMLRFRERDPKHIPPQVHGHTGLELAWTIAPAVLLLAIGIPMVATIYDLGREPSEDAFRVNVTAQRYNWIFEYPEYTDEDGNPLTLIDQEFHVPSGREVAFYLSSVDVIHSFWLPKLGGKLDIIPGQVNVLWLRADEPGSFSGQCAEFCGLNHADMTKIVIAQPQEELDAWAAEMLE
ncbi:MAG TPA: cytochrome c oxidase subunit II [Dehalococcoidia bacterium]